MTLLINQLTKNRNVVVLAKFFLCYSLSLDYHTKNRHFRQRPAFLIIDGILGNWLYKKYMPLLPAIDAGVRRVHQWHF